MTTDNRQTRIFVPSDEPPYDWVETLVGKVFHPLTMQFADSLRWFWFSRYATDDPAESGDCDISQIPANYKQGGHRSMRFRFSIKNNRQKQFERTGEAIISAKGYAISDFRAYDFIADTGNSRFLGNENRQAGRKEQRADLVTQFYAAISRLVVDALVGPDENGRYRLETNDDHANNPQGSTFQSLLHLFCNITDVPTQVYIFHKKASALLGYGTFMYHPNEPQGGWDAVTAVSVRY